MIVILINIYKFSEQTRQFIRPTIIIIFSFIAFTKIYIFITKKGSPLVFIKDIKSFPLVSPVFCLGAPAFWSKSLGSLGLSVASIKNSFSIFIFDWYFFIIGLILYLIIININSQVNTDVASAPKIAKMANMLHTPQENSFKYTGKTALGFILVGMSFLVAVILNISLNIYYS